MPEEKKDEGTIILQTRMHCGECSYKVYKAIIGYPGVEDVNISLPENKATLKAPKVDAKKLFESVKKKSGGKVIALLYPDPKDIKKKEEAKKEEKKPVEVTVVLKVAMDCSSCRRKVTKVAWKIKDVQSVKVEDEKLTIKGTDLDPKKVCDAIIKKSGKHAEVVPPKKEDGNQKEKDGDKKDDGAKKEEKQAPQTITQYVYAPQYFSDENPNACVLM